MGEVAFPSCFCRTRHEKHLAQASFLGTCHPSLSQKSLLLPSQNSRGLCHGLLHGGSVPTPPRCSCFLFPFLAGLLGGHLPLPPASLSAFCFLQFLRDLDPVCCLTQSLSSLTARWDSFLSPLTELRLFHPESLFHLLCSWQFWVGFRLPIPTHMFPFPPFPHELLSSGTRPSCSTESYGQPLSPHGHIFCSSWALPLGSRYTGLLTTPAMHAVSNSVPPLF